MSDDNRFGGNAKTPAGGIGANQDFGFFAGGSASAPSQFGTPAPSRAQVSPPSQFGGPPPAGAPSQFGTPPAPSPLPPPPAAGQFGPPPGPAAPVWQGAPPGYPPQQYAPAPRRGLPVWAIVAICVPVAVVVVLILAAIAIPVFLNQRDKAVAAATTVSAPTQVAGLNATTDAAALQQLHSMMGEFPTCGCFDPPVASMFTTPDGSHVVLAGAAKVPAGFHSADQTEFVRGFWHAAGSSFAGAHLGASHIQNAGKLGGSMTCAPISGSMSGNICLAVDGGSFFFVFDAYRTGSIDPNLPTTAREAFVHRT